MIDKTRSKRLSFTALTIGEVMSMEVKPLESMASASESFATDNPIAPNSNCNLAIVEHLCVLQ